MYTLSKAKEEIDAVAKHALDIAAHALAIDENLNAKLESFKQDVLARIDAKFADLEKAVLGEARPSETTAVSDLAAKVALLKPDASPSIPQDQGHHEDQGHHHEHGHHHHEHGHHDQGRGGEHHDHG